MRKRLKFVLGTLTVFLLALMPSVVPVGDSIAPAFAAESVSYDFNAAGDMAANFDIYASAGTISQSVSGGIGNSGAIEVDPLVTTNAVLATKDGYSLGPVGSSYTFSSQMRSFSNGGYSGMGFTSLTPSSTNASGTPYHPKDAIGASVHGGGFVFHNGVTNVNGSWNGTYNNPGGNGLYTVSTGAGMVTGCDDATQDACWFEVVFKITRDTSTTFDARLELYGSSQSGVLDSPTPIAVFEFRDQTNATLTAAPLLYSYINFSGQRMKFFDDFQVDLAGGASVIAAGAPVVLTSSANESSGSVTVSGNVTSDGGASVTDRGFVYSTSSNPTTADTKISIGTGTGSFSDATSSLADATYYFRAFATNSVATSYGSQQTVTVSSTTVTFNRNDGTGITSTQSSRSSASLETNSFTRAGYTFMGWNSAADGSGTAYADGATYAFGSDLTLYAVWFTSLPPVVAANDAYVQPGDANGAASSALVLKNAADSASNSYNRVGYARFEFDPAYVWSNAAFEMMVASNTDGASNNGYNRSYTTFNVDVWAMSDASWDDTLRFSGANASVQDWGIDTSTWPWSPEGGTYLGTISIPTSSSTVGQTYSLSNATLASFLNSDVDGEVTLFFRRSDLDNQGNLSFASIENSNPSYHGPRLVAPSGSYSYTIAYDVNGGSGTLPSPGTYAVGSSGYTIAAPSSVAPPSGETFAGWNSKADGSGTSYSVGSSYSTPASATLYAQFTTNPVVTFDSNDGTSVSAYQAVTSGSPTALIGNTFSRAGYTFGGWNTAADGSGTSYSDGANITSSSGVTLYAQWAAASSGGSSGGGAASSPASTPVTPPVVVPPRVIVPPQPIPVPRVLTGPVASPGRGFDPNVGTRATIGGAPATVTKRPLGSQGVSVQAGSFQLGINLGTPQPSTSSGSAGSDLTVPTGQATKVTGVGLLPGSQLQVWLPGMRGNTAKELARIPVSDDGTFDSELSFTARQSETPIPIGRQVLQVAGYDAEGNQTVVDMTINIGQGAPAPEPNKTVNALPELNPGQSLATSAGVPEIVTIEARVETREVVVLSGEWSFNVSLPENSGVVEEVGAGATLTLIQARTASVSGDGFQPETRVDIWLFSEPTLLGSVVVSADGSFTGEVYLDARYAIPGQHTLQLQGVADDGFIKAANLGVVVQEPLMLTSENATGLLWWLLIAVVVVLVVVTLFVVVRRRRVL